MKPFPLIALTCAIVIAATACTADSTAPTTGQATILPATEADLDLPRTDPGLLTEVPENLATTLSGCLASDRPRWTAQSLGAADLLDMWGDLSWIDEVADPVSRAQYEDVFVLSAGLHPVGAQKLLAAVNAALGAGAPARARDIEGWMNEQYNPQVPDHAEEFDASFLAELQAAASRMELANHFVGQASPAAQPYVRLTLEGTVYNDEFAQACGASALANASQADQQALQSGQEAIAQVEG